MPLEQLSQALTCVPQFTTGGTGATGLTVTVDVYRVTNGAHTSLVTGASATEIAHGTYRYSLASSFTGVEGLYVFCFITTGTADLKKIIMGWSVSTAGVENLDALISSRASAADYTTARAAKIDNLDATISSRSTLTTGQAENAVLDATAASHNTAGTIGQKINSAAAATDPLLNAVPGTYASGTAGAALGRLAASSVTISGAVDPTTLDLTIIPGDSYTAARARAFTFSIGSTPNLTSATVRMVIERGTVDVLTLTATVTGAGTGTQSLSFDMTAAQSAKLTQLGEDVYTYQVEASWATDSPATLFVGNVTAARKYTA